MMDARRNGLVLLALLLLTQTTISAQTDSMGKDVPVDSVSVATSDSLQTKRSFFKKFLDYFNDANKEKKNKKFDFSVIGGPHYSSDTKFGLGLVAAGLYRTDRNDSILPPFECFSLWRCLYCWILSVGSKRQSLVPAREIPVEL